jgi:uncharacterized protein
MSGWPAAEAEWARIRTELDEIGFSVVPSVLDAGECARLVVGYLSDRFRSTIPMARHGFGRGEYKYYDRPLPETVQKLRSELYERLAPVANGWTEALGREPAFPPAHADFLAACHSAGQTRPTPLILKYGPGDYNCLHQDIYGSHVFPLQAAVLLSDPAAFDGGEFVFTEQRPRRQSRASVVPLAQGDAVIFTVRERPARGSRGFYRVQHRHGVSTLRSGERYCLGLVLHDAA